VAPVLNTLVQDHGDVGAEGGAESPLLFQALEMLRAVEVRTEAHAFIGNLSQFREAENLVARRESVRIAPFHDMNLCSRRVCG